MTDLPNVRTDLGNIREHTVDVAAELTSLWPIYYLWGTGPTGHHKAGRALDLMVLTLDQRSLRKGVGDQIAAYVRQHHKRLGVQYLIWKQRIWNATRRDDNPHRKGWSTWRRMEDRGSTTANHMDHVHVSLLDHPPTYRPPASQREEPVALDKDDLDRIVRTVWNTDGVLASPSRRGDPANQYWTARSYLAATYDRVDRLVERQAQQAQAIQALGAAIEALADGLPPQVREAVHLALGDLVTVDVTVTTDTDTGEDT